MRVLVWVVEDTWTATVSAAAAIAPAGAEITLLYVIAGEAERVAEGARSGLLGRRHPPPAPPGPPLEAISEHAARALLADASDRLGRSTATELRRGRVEREVVSAAADADLLVLARGGDRRRPGPKSLGHHVRFVVDHAPCEVLLVWPGAD